MDRVPICQRLGNPAVESQERLESDWEASPIVPPRGKDVASRPDAPTLAMRCGGRAPACAPNCASAADAPCHQQRPPTPPVLLSAQA